MKKSIVVFAVVTFALAGAAGAGEWWIPAAAHANGAQGSVWRTDVVIHNFGTSTEQLTITLLPQNTDNTSMSRVDTLTVAPAETIVVEDILEDVFGFSGTAAMNFQAAGDQLMLTSRTYNLGDAGTFGQAIPAVSSPAITAGTAYTVLGLSGTEGRRTNVGWVSLSQQPVSVTIKLFSNTGTRLAERTFSKSFGFWQNQVELFSALGVAPADEVYAVITSEGSILPYASVVASGSNDPISVSAMAALEAGTELLFPAVAHVAGAAGTSWRTDAWILNTGTQPATLTLEFRPQNGGNTHWITLENTLEPGEQLALKDVLATVLGLDSAQGSLTVQSDLRLLATSRTFNTAPQGTFGQFIPARSATSLAGTGEPAVLGGIAWDQHFRSNIGVVATAAGSRVRFVLRDAAGVEQATAARNLDAGEQRQFSVTSLFNLSSVEAGSIVEVTLESADEGGRLAAYVSIVDNGSSDPTYGEAWRTLAGAVDPDDVASILLTSTYALSTAVEQSGPQAFAKTTVDCIDVDYEGDTVLPGQSVEGKCWIADLTFNDCQWTFPTIGWSLAQDGTASADVCMIDGRENVFSADLVSTVEDLGTGKQVVTTLGALMTIVMAFDGSVPESTALVGELDVSINGSHLEAVADLVWEDAVVGLQFIPTGVLVLRFPYETDLGMTTAEVVSTFDGTEWVLVESRVGYWHVKFYINIFTGEIQFI